MSRPHRPRKRFGQHFLSAPLVIEKILDAIYPQAGDRIVEIGPGQGAITEPLARNQGELHLIELDRDLAAMLGERFSDRPNVILHQEDALNFDFASLGKKLRIVGNLPYNISTPLLFHLIEHRQHILDMHFMLQKEVVDRMAAQEGNKSFGRLTIMLGCYLHVEPLFDVPPSAFTPPPKVDSSVVRLTPRTDVHKLPNDPALLKQLVTQAFSQRRKTLRNALKALAPEATLEAAGIDPGTRAEQVPIARWVALADRLSAA